MAVVDPDLDLVDAVCVGVGRGLEIRGRVEAQHAGVGVDAEQRRIAAAGQAEGGRVARIHVRGRDGGHPGLVLRRVHRRRRPPAVGVDHRHIVDVGHVDRKVLGRRERAVEDRQHHVFPPTAALPGVPDRVAVPSPLSLRLSQAGRVGAVMLRLAPLSGSVVVML